MTWYLITYEVEVDEDEGEYQALRFIRDKLWEEPITIEVAGDSE